MNKSKKHQWRRCANYKRADGTVGYYCKKCALVSYFGRGDDAKTKQSTPCEA